MLGLLRNDFWRLSLGQPRFYLLLHVLLVAGIELVWIGMRPVIVLEVLIDVVLDIVRQYLLVALFQLYARAFYVLIQKTPRNISPNSIPLAQSLVPGAYLVADLLLLVVRTPYAPFITHVYL